MLIVYICKWSVVTFKCIDLQLLSALSNHDIFDSLLHYLLSSRCFKRTILCAHVFSFMFIGTNI